MRNFKDEVMYCANRVWDIIGDDCLCDEYGKIDYSATVSRDEVVELVMDADRLRTLGNLSSENYSKFMKLPYDEKEAIVKKAFSCERYGW